MKDHNESQAVSYAKGLLLGVIAAVLFSSSSLFAKIGTPNYEVFLLLFAKNFFQTLFSLPLASYYKKPFFGKPKDWPLLFFRTFLGFCSLSAQFFAYKYVSLGDVAVLISLAPLWAMILGRIFLKEPCQISDIFLMLVSCGGVLLVVQPPFIFGSLEVDTSVKDRLIGSTLAIASSVLTASVATALRKVVQTVHYTTANITYFSLMTVVSLILTLAFGWFKYPPTYSERGILFGMGIMACGGANAITASSVYLPGGISTLIRRGLSVVLSYILQILVLGKIPNLLSILGAGIITCALMAMGTKNVMQKYYKDTDANVNCFVKFVLKLR